MGLIVCPSCERQKELKPIKKGAKFSCSNCRCREALIIRHVKLGMKRGDLPGIDMEEAQRQTYAGLLRVVEYKGYKPGWAAMKFRTLYGVFPPRSMGVVQPQPATSALALWLKKQRKEYAKTLRAKEKRDLFMAETPTPKIDYNGFVAGTYMTADDYAVKL